MTNLFPREGKMDEKLLIVLKNWFNYEFNLDKDADIEFIESLDLHLKRNGFEIKEVIYQGVNSDPRSSPSFNKL